MRLRTQILLSFLFCLTISFVLFMLNLQKRIVDVNQQMTEDFNSQLISMG